jgi:hypothetical protein
VVLNLLATRQRVDVLHDDMSRLEEWALKVDGSFDTVREAQEGCAEKCDEIHLTVKWVDQTMRNSMRNFYVQLQGHHDHVNECTDKVLLKIAHMDQKIDKMMSMVSIRRWKNLKTGKTEILMSV